MKPPDDVSRPFFAYGLFKPGQLAYFQLRSYVSSVPLPASISGELVERDGLPIYDPNGRGSVTGALLTFKRDHAADAYNRIAGIEPDKQYVWKDADIDGLTVNVLVGKSPRKGSAPLETPDWDGWADPLFGAALEVVEETAESASFNWDLRSLFKLQMAYLLLWTSIERYLSLRYRLRGDVMTKISRIAGEPEFGHALTDYAKVSRRVQRADRPDQPIGLDPGNPQKAVQYYYQVRSNITHRGKAAVRDYDTLKDSLTELLPIFRAVLAAAEADAQQAPDI